eukprot:comp22315_c0_seq1/m.53492 comp22315_c0_seq1/g.53492  ORF comp22315_c0_seq1/g.53492 comp22315_c0_seq1/m.53492 type:complete len:726 (+) comp22315_c0_seq1:1494-3671(+)
MGLEIERIELARVLHRINNIVVHAALVDLVDFQRINRHLVRHVVVLRMHASRVKHILAVHDPQESSAVAEHRRTDIGTHRQLCARGDAGLLERPEQRAHLGRAQTAHKLQRGLEMLVLCGKMQIHTHKRRGPDESALDGAAEQCVVKVVLHRMQLQDLEVSLAIDQMRKCGDRVLHLAGQRKTCGHLWLSIEIEPGIGAKGAAFEGAHGDMGVHVGHFANIASQIAEKVLIMRPIDTEHNQLRAVQVNELFQLGDLLVLARLDLGTFALRGPDVIEAHMVHLDALAIHKCGIDRAALAKHNRQHTRRAVNGAPRRIMRVVAAFVRCCAAAVGSGVVGLRQIRCPHQDVLELGIDLLAEQARGDTGEAVAHILAEHGQHLAVPHFIKHERTQRVPLVGAMRNVAALQQLDRALHNVLVGAARGLCGDANANKALALSLEHCEPHRGRILLGRTVLARRAQGVRLAQKVRDWLLADLVDAAIRVVEIDLTQAARSRICGHHGKGPKGLAEVGAHRRVVQDLLANHALCELNHLVCRRTVLWIDKLLCKLMRIHPRVRDGHLLPSAREIQAKVCGIQRPEFGEIANPGLAAVGVCIADHRQLRPLVCGRLGAVCAGNLGCATSLLLCSRGTIHAAEAGLIFLLAQIAVFLVLAVAVAVAHTRGDVAISCMLVRLGAVASRGGSAALVVALENSFVFGALAVDCKLNVRRDVLDGLERASGAQELKKRV